VKARRKARCWLERRGRVMDDIDPRTRAERDWRALMDGAAEPAEVVRRRDRRC